jgi:hypothetical protein
MTFTRSQNYTSVLVGEHEVQTFEGCGCCGGGNGQVFF